MTDSFGEYFLVLRADGLYVIFISGLKVWVLPLVQDSFRFLYPEFGARFASICSRRPLFQNWFSFTLFPLTERRCHFRFRVLANHLASIFFLSLVTECKHLLAFTLTHILYFIPQAVKNWPILLFCLYGHSLGGLLIQTRRGRGHSLSLSPQWSTTWH